MAETSHQGFAMAPMHMFKFGNFQEKTKLLDLAKNRLRPGNTDFRPTANPILVYPIQSGYG